MGRMQQSGSAPQPSIALVEKRETIDRIASWNIYGNEKRKIYF